MAGRADVPTHLDVRRTILDSLFDRWADPDLSAAERADIIQDHFDDLGLGKIERVGAGNSVYTEPEHPEAGRANVLVIGRHDVEDLAPGDPASGTAGAAAQGLVTGPGVAGRLGPTIAFAEGAAAARELVGSGPLNLRFVSLGEGDRLTDVADIAPTAPVDCVIITNAVTFSPTHPTLSVGSRGQLTVQLRLDAGAAVDDFTTAGAFRNPLSKMMQVLGSLRSPTGRIALPGFYDRAFPPDTRVRSSMYDADHDPDAWADELSIARPEGGVSGLERVSMWPGVSALSMEHDTGGMGRAPRSVTATVAFYLVPDQRPIEIEQSIRQWFLDATPDELRPTVTILASHRPWRSDPDARPTVAQRLAALRVFGREPISVPAGGPPGAGEVAFALDAPLLFAGIAAPSRSFGTYHETMTRSTFDAGVELAAETCLQLRRD